MKWEERNARPGALEGRRSRVFALFSFFGGIGLRESVNPLLILTLASVLTLFLIPLGIPFWILFGATFISMASIVVRRLRRENLGWGWILISIIPIIGWATLAVLVGLDRNKTGTSESFARRMLVILASFLTIALLATSFSIKTLDSELALRAQGAWETQQQSTAEADSLASQEAEAREVARVAEAEAQDAARRVQAEAAAAEREAALDDLERRGEDAGQANQTGIDATFEQLISSLRVEPEFIGGYDRNLFPYWIDANANGCNTRQEVLIAESAIPVTIGPRCAITGGTWYSHFDGQSFSDPSGLDVDHFVPLAEAWRSGAHQWDRTTRERFANDLGYSMSLIAVSASSNRSKGDKDVARWMPSNRDFICEYSYSWAKVKVRWSLSVDETELSALESNWSGCLESNLVLQSVTSQAPIGLSESRAPQQQPPASQQAAPGNCVDINSAPAADLMAIIHIGPARAAALESLRPFSNLDALIRINGIGPSRLSDIKAQGLACVR